MILGVVVVAFVIALIAMSGRRERDVVVQSRIEERRVGEPPVTTYESEIERERRRRAS